MNPGTIGEQLVEENVQRAKDTYAAFLRGDLDSVMRGMADVVEWVFPGPSGLPLAGTIKGKQAVQTWIGTLASEIDFQVFEPYQLIAQGDTVVALIHAEATVRHTQRRYTNEAAQVLTYRGGTLVQFQAFEDTEAIMAAYRGE